MQILLLAILSPFNEAAVFPQPLTTPHHGPWQTFPNQPPVSEKPASLSHLAHLLDRGERLSLNALQKVQKRRRAVQEAKEISSVQRAVPKTASHPIAVAHSVGDRRKRSPEETNAFPQDDDQDPTAIGLVPVGIGPAEMQRMISSTISDHLTTAAPTQQHVLPPSLKNYLQPTAVVRSQLRGTGRDGGNKPSSGERNGEREKREGNKRAVESQIVAEGKQRDELTGRPAEDGKKLAALITPNPERKKRRRSPDTNNEHHRPPVRSQTGLVPVGLDPESMQRIISSTIADNEAPAVETTTGAQGDGSIDLVPMGVGRHGGE